MEAIFDAAFLAITSSRHRSLAEATEILIQYVPQGKGREVMESARKLLSREQRLSVKILYGLVLNG
ncbi:hypothetical protein [Streptomyces sp. NPDC056061]|uniref:hypothetical protein n=1 Tax=Streptomyces sp. NPDC056061 TaxID=3345700 RepID=UPI0035D9DFD8